MFIFIYFLIAQLSFLNRRYMVEVTDMQLNYGWQFSVNVPKGKTMVNNNNIGNKSLHVTIIQTVSGLLKI